MYLCWPTSSRDRRECFVFCACFFYELNRARHTKIAQAHGPNTLELLTLFFMLLNDIN